MRINFTGIKNVGYETRQYFHYVNNHESGDEFEEVEDEHFLNLELTDDKDGNDLSEFKKMIKTTDLNYYDHPVDPAMLNIAISRDVVRDYLGQTIDYQVYINEADKELVIKDENLPFFTYLAKLMNKVKNTPDNKFKLEDDYLYSKDAAVSVIIGEDLKDTYGESYPDALKEIYSPQKIKSGISTMNNLIKDMMTDYFN